MRTDILVGASDESAAQTLAAADALQKVTGTEIQLVKLRSPLRVIDGK